MRPSWDDYFLNIAFLVASRSTCIRRHVGAVAVKDHRIIATGYNGPLSGKPHCTEQTCFRIVNNIPSGEQLDKCYAVHAEMNLVAQAARYGVNFKGCKIYCTDSPCVACSKILLAAGAESIHFCGKYNTDGFAESLWGEGRMFYVKDPQIAGIVELLYGGNNRSELPHDDKQKIRANSGTNGLNHERNATCRPNPFES